MTLAKSINVIWLTSSDFQVFFSKYTKSISSETGGPKPSTEGALGRPDLRVYF